jgi:hypothetical protein
MRQEPSRVVRITIDLTTIGGRSHGKSVNRSHACVSSRSPAPRSGAAGQGALINHQLRNNWYADPLLENKMAVFSHWRARQEHLIEA